MTKSEVIHAFFSGFGLRAYEENSVPEYLDGDMTQENNPPYLTYQYGTDDFRGYPVPVTVNLWDYSDSWTFLREKTEEISQYIGRFSRLVCDDGYIAVSKGSPFSEPVTFSRPYKRVVLNLYLTFITN